MNTTTKQKVYDFYLDQKVTTWYRTNFEIEADSEEEAKQKALEFFKRGDHVDISWEHLDDCVEGLTPADNGGESTMEVYYSDDHGDVLEIYSNKQ
jgi:hypothetical protein